MTEDITKTNPNHKETSPQKQGSTAEANQNTEKSDNKSVSLWAIIGSVFAAAFGIQSDENRKRDFRKGRPTDFIVMGVIFVVILITGMILFVHSVIPS
jgi:hypothetical protein